MKRFEAKCKDKDFRGAIVLQKMLEGHARKTQFLFVVRFSGPSTIAGGCAEEPAFGGSSAGDGL